MFSAGGGGNATELIGVQINSSNYGNPLPIVYGTNRLNTNCLWFNDFNAKAVSQGGKGGGGATGYSYSAAVMLAICEGPITGVTHIYKDRTILSIDGAGNTPLQQESLTISLGSQTQVVWSYLTANHPDQAIAYAGTAWVANSTMQLDSNAGIPQYNFEVGGLFQAYSGYNNRGAWSGGSNYVIGDQVTDPTNTFSYVCFLAINAGGGQPHTLDGVNWLLLPGPTPDAKPGDIIVDLLTNPRYGAGFPSGSIADLTDYDNYCIAVGFFFSPCYNNAQQLQQNLTDLASWSNSEIVWSQGQLKMIPYGDEEVTGNGVTWTPDTSPVRYFSDDDYIVNADQDPITIARVSPSDANNDFKMSFSDRLNGYNSGIAEAMDQSAIDLYGIRTANQVSADGICVAPIAQLSVQLMLQRSIYIRNTYTFTLSAANCDLEPMDIIAVTDSLLGLFQYSVRIVDIQEDDNLNLQITADDYIIGVGTATANAVQSRASPPPSNGIGPPGNVATPVLFNVPPPNSSFSPREVGIAVSGQSTNWGGCQVWVGTDPTAYAYQGAIEGASRYGVNTADFPSHSDPDTSDTLSVDLTASGGTLSPGSTADADAGGTLCMIGTEAISYTAATLTAPFKYDLTGYIRRGQLNTPLGDHPIGNTFVRMDDSIFRLDVSKLRTGVPMYIKFLSFDLQGKNLQSLADVTQYTYTPGDAALISNSVSNLMLATPWLGTSFTLTWTAPQFATSFTVNVYKSDGVTLLRTATVTATTYTYTQAFALTDGDLERTYVIKVIANSTGGAAPATSITVNNPPPAIVTGVTSSGTGGTVTISWGASGAVDFAGYLAFYSIVPGFDPTIGGGTQFYSGIATSVLLPGLTPGTTYYVRVAAFDAWSSNPAFLTFSSQYTFTA